MTASVSFGHKIPITQFQVKNQLTGNFEKAYLYELDCSSVNDIFHMEKLKGNFSFKEQIINNMWKKLNKRDRNNDDVNFYTAETESKKAIGICETYMGSHYKDITYISSDKLNNYKYSGQTMIASVGKTILKNLKLVNLLVSTPLNDAMKFYKDICGFEEVTLDKCKLLLRMDRNKIREFIREVETRTNSSVIDLTNM